MPKGLCLALNKSIDPISEALKLVESLRSGLSDLGSFHSLLYDPPQGDLHNLNNLPIDAYCLTVQVCTHH